MKLTPFLLVLALGACGDSEETETPPPDPVETFMTRYFETFDRYVQDDILALFDANVQADISGLGMLDGRDAVRDEWLIPFTSAFPDYTHTVNSLTVSGNRATADFVFSGTHQGELLGNAPTGKQLTLPILGTYDVTNNVVTSFTLEYDIAIVLDTIMP